MQVPRRQMEKARIEIIPMIDIIFFLLVFFMVSTLVMTINRGLPVNLPKAASSQKDLRESFNVTVMQDGTLFLNKEATTLEQLGQQVRTSVEKEPELVLIINADDQALHGAIVSVMDEVRLAGVSRLAIAVRPDGGRTHEACRARSCILDFSVGTCDRFAGCVAALGIATFPHGTFRSHSG